MPFNIPRGNRNLRTKTDCNLTDNFLIGFYRELAFHLSFLGGGGNQGEPKQNNKQTKRNSCLQNPVCGRSPAFSLL